MSHRLYLSMSDAELIRKYLVAADQLAASTLVKRHYQFVLSRLKSLLPIEEAEDRAQKIWSRLFEGALQHYNDDGRFKHYLAVCARNEANQYWQGTDTRSAVVSLHEYDIEDSLWMTLKDASPEELQLRADLLTYLVNEVIPGLPPLKRMVWLLRNEAEFFDASQTINWQTLSQLNGLSVEETWLKFETARDYLLLRYRDPDGRDIDTEALSIFLVWTHAQRPVRDGKYTLKHIADVVGVSESTLKDRYYDAEKRVAKALADFDRQGDK